MDRYAVFLHEAVFRSPPRTRSQRVRIDAFIDHVAHFPHQTPDRSFADAGGRVRDVRILNDMEVIYWVDVPAKIVQIVDVHYLGASKRKRR